MGKSERSKALNRADEWFSKYIRLSKSLKNGYGRCFTCGKIKNLKGMHAGHFVARQKMGTRFDEKNVQIQCIECNKYYEGRKYEYGKRLNKLYGDGTAEKLEQTGLLTKKTSAFELREIAKHYREKYNKLREDGWIWN